MVYQTPARLRSESAAMIAAADELSLPELPPRDDSDAAETTNTAHSSPLKQQTRPVQRSPDENVRHSGPPSNASTARPAKSKSPSPSPSSLRASPSARARRPLGARASSQPVVSSLEVESAAQKERAPSLPPSPAKDRDEEEVAEEENEDSDSSVKGRGWKGATRSPRVPALTDSTSTNDSSDDDLTSPPATEERGGPVILSASGGVARPYTSSEDDEDSHEMAAEAPELSLLARMPSRGELNRRGVHQYTPGNRSNLHEVINASFSGSSSGTASAQVSPVRKTSTGRPVSPLQDAETPKAKAMNHMKEYVLLNTASKPARLNIASKSRLASGTPFRKQAFITSSSDDESTGSYGSEGSSSSRSITIGMEGEDHRANNSMPIRGVEDAALDNKIDQQSLLRHLQSVNAALSDQCNQGEAQNAELQERNDRLKLQLARIKREHDEQMSRLQAQLEDAYGQAEDNIEGGKRAADDLLAERDRVIAEQKRVLANKDAEHSRLERQLEEKSRQLQGANAERTELRTLLEQRNEESDPSSGAERLQNLDKSVRIQQLEDDLAKKDSLLQSTNNRRIEEQQRVEKVEQELDQLQTANNDLEAALTHQSALVQSAQAESHEFEMALGKVSGECQQLKEALEEAHEENRALREEEVPEVLEERDAMIRQLEIDNQRLLGDVETLQNELQEERERQVQTGDAGRQQQHIIEENIGLRRSRRDHEAKVTELATQLERQTQQLARAQQNVERLRDELASKDQGFRSEVEVLRRQHQEMDSPVSVAWRSVRAVSTPPRPDSLGSLSLGTPLANISAASPAVVRQYLQQIVELKAQLHQLTTQTDRKIQKLEDELAKKKSELNNAEERVIHLENELSRAEETGHYHSLPLVDRERAELARLREDKDRIQANLNKVRFQLSQAREEADTSNHQTQARATENAALHKEVDELIAELHKVRSTTAEKRNVVDKLDTVNKLQRELAQSHSDRKRERAAHDRFVADFEAARQELHAVRLDADDIGNHCAGLAKRIHRGGAATNGEVKTLLRWIRYLKQRCTRQEAFTAHVTDQKIFVSNQLVEALDKLNATRRTLAKHGLHYPSPSANGRRTFRGVAMSVLATVYMQKSSREWRQKESTKQEIRDSWEVSRGRRFPKT